MAKKLKIQSSEEKLQEARNEIAAYAGLLSRTCGVFGLEGYTADEKRASLCIFLREIEVKQNEEEEKKGKDPF